MAIRRSSVAIVVCVVACLLLVSLGQSALFAQRKKGQQPPFVLPDNVEMKTGVVFGKGGGRDLKLALFLPKDKDQRKPMPAMVFYHGGGWRGGTPRQFYRQAALLAAQGIVGVCPEYRLSGEAKYPAAVEDAKCAIRWLRANAKQLNVDPSRIGCAGGSAGGHLAAMVATTAKLKKLEGNGGHPEQSSAVQLAVIFNGALDLRELTTGEKARTAVLSFLGGAPEQMPEVYKEASPIVHVDADTPPCLLFHGTNDTTIPYQQSVRFKEAVEKAGGEAKVVLVEGVGHGFFNRSPYFEQTYTEMEKFIKQHFGLEGSK